MADIITHAELTRFYPLKGGAISWLRGDQETTLPTPDT